MGSFPDGKSKKRENTSIILMFLLEWNISKYVTVSSETLLASIPNFLKKNKNVKEIVEQIKKVFLPDSKYKEKRAEKNNARNGLKIIKNNIYT
jgi:hypothetical protein